MTYQELATYRQMIVKCSASLSDEDALNVPNLFDEWRAGVEYKVEEKDGKLIKPRILYEDVLYRVEQTHVSQEGWEPPKVPALFTRVPKPGEIEVWRQPTGAQDAYNTGDKVHYPTIDDPVYISTCDANVWQPGVYGWDLYNEGGES